MSRKDQEGEFGDPVVLADPRASFDRKRSERLRRFAEDLVPALEEALESVASQPLPLPKDNLEEG